MVRLGLSHLTDHKFRHNFQDCLNPICDCGQEIETTSHFLLHCLNYRCARKTFFEKINLIDSNILQQSDLSITNDLLFGHIFKNLILKFIRPKPNRISSTQNFEGLKLLTRMRLGLSHLADHKFRNNFQDCLNPSFSCSQKIETSHLLLHCRNYRCARF